MQADDETKSFVVDTTQAIIDLALKDNVIGKFPFMQFLLAAREICNNIQNAWFLKKMKKYLDSPYIATEREIESFMKDIKGKDYEELNDMLLHGLNIAEDEIKCVYLKMLVDSVIRKRCSVDEAKTMAFVIQSLYSRDIGNIIYEKTNPQRNSEGFKERLHILDILERDLNLGKDFQNEPENIDVMYKITKFGDLFLKCLFPKKYDEIMASNEKRDNLMQSLL
jgi:hypothetical protein